MNDVQRRQLEETMNRERRSKSSWAMQHAEEEAGRITAYKLDDMKHQRLHNLREQVADWPIVWSRAAAYGPHIPPSAHCHLYRLPERSSPGLAGRIHTHIRTRRRILLQVADLCDLQPTPANMVRPARKVRALRPWPEPALVRLASASCDPLSSTRLPARSSAHPASCSPGRRCLRT